MDETAETDHEQKEKPGKKSEDSSDDSGTEKKTGQALLDVPKDLGAARKQTSVSVYRSVAKHESTDPIYSKALRAASPRVRSTELVQTRWTTSDLRLSSVCSAFSLYRTPQLSSSTLTCANFELCLSYENPRIPSPYVSRMPGSVSGVGHVHSDPLLVYWTLFCALHHLRFFAPHPPSPPTTSGSCILSWSIWTIRKHGLLDVHSWCHTISAPDLWLHVQTPSGPH
jgi:hypothetical protein